MSIPLKLSVRELVEFTLSSGSISSGFLGYDRAMEGSRIHRLLQKKADKNYVPEVFLSHTLLYKNFTFTISGRADGVITNENSITIDEIKSTSGDLPGDAKSSPEVHWAQAMCYGYFYSYQKDLETITIQLTYYQRDSKEIRRFNKLFTFVELKQYFCNLLDIYVIWAQMQNDWIRLRNDSIHSLSFPFLNYRPGQRQMAVAIYKTIINNRRLFCEAPTGIGKTISSLFPGIKSMGEGVVEKIFYLTAKTITRQVAMDTLLLLKKHGLNIKTVVLTAKDKICFLEKRDCNPVTCPYAAGYYDRLKNGLYSLLTHYEFFSREVIEAGAMAWKLCPFELSLDLSLWCDIIVGDYNYLFDPVVSLQRYFAENENRFLFLIDEAHNLVDRSRQMFSGEILKSDFLLLKRALGNSSSGLSKITKKINDFMITLRKSCAPENHRISVKPIKELNELLLVFSFTCETWLKKNPESQSLVLDLYFNIKTYLRISELYDEGYITLIKTFSSEVMVKQLCLDPASGLDQGMKLGKSSILFSGTLSPLPYFVDVLGGAENTSAITLPSPFMEEKLGVFIAPKISTRYLDRENSIPKIVEMIFTFIQGKVGNYMIYFPSYQYMEDISHAFLLTHPNIPLCVQSRDMDEAAREEFLDSFKLQDQTTFLGFCVLGGIYSEGIDLVGDRLIGTVIVGVGLPRLNLETNILRDYYDTKQGAGYSFAYQYPGMNKVLQAVGRVIRSDSDWGVTLLIDTRFNEWQYRKLFPKHWQHYKIINNPKELSVSIETFWKTSLSPDKNEDNL